MAIFKGDFPDIVKDVIGNRSQAQGFESSRLPPFSNEEKDMIKGSVDFLGLNMYTSDLAQPYQFPIEDVSAASDNGVSDNLGNLDDLLRIYYYKHYINNVLKAVKIDQCNVEGYIAWSLLDNFEWSFDTA